MTLGQEQVMPSPHTKARANSRVDLINGGVIDKGGKAMPGEISLQAREQLIVQTCKKDVIVLTDGVGREIAVGSIRGRGQVGNGKDANERLRLSVGGKFGSLKQIGALDGALTQRQ
jgi:hypothetical protein